MAANLRAKEREGLEDLRGRIAAQFIHPLYLQWLEPVNQQRREE